MNTHPLVICEIGCNHMGKIELAYELIKVAKEFCNVDIVKFQKQFNISVNVQLANRVFPR